MGSSYTLVPSENGKKELGLMSADDICKLMETARKASLLEFSYGELSFKLGEPPLTAKEAADNIGRRKEDFRTEVIELKARQAEELALTDPTAYEEFVERSLNNSQGSHPELERGAIE